MASSTQMVLHCGARSCTHEELNGIPAPEPMGRWYPLAHSTVFHQVKETLMDAGFLVERERLALSRNDHRFFGTLDLRAELAPGVALAVGIRNSTDQSFPLGFCAGSRVFVCDNLSFNAELLVKRKHTKNGQTRFGNDIVTAIGTLEQFRIQESRRIEVMQMTEIGDDHADALILRAYERKIITAPSLPQVIKTWREPTHEEFAPRTLWSLMNACTEVLGKKATHNPQQYASTTMRLARHLAGPLAIEAVQDVEVLEAAGV